MSNWPPPRTQAQINWEKRCNANLQLLVTMLAGIIGFAGVVIAITWFS